jgi:hypothetical protein
MKKWGILCGLLALLSSFCFAAEELEWVVVDSFVADNRLRWIICRSGDEQALFFADYKSSTEDAVRRGDANMMALFLTIDIEGTVNNKWVIYSKPLDPTKVVDILFENKECVAVPYTEIVRVQSKR